MKISDPYEGFSHVFDQVVSEEKYDTWENWILSIWKKHSYYPKSLLDLACGTGINSMRFANRDIEVFGIDNSPSMLKVAMQKNSSISFSRGHFLNFSLPQKVDAALCLDFSTNYIIREGEFLDFLNNVHAYLNNGGIFIFDMKPTEAFHKKARSLQKKEFDFDWSCDTTFSPFVIIDMDITLHSKDNPQKFHERHIERGYTLLQMKQIIEDSSFKLLGIYDNCTSAEPSDSSDLLQFVLQK